MADPITLAALGALALTEGVKFLYSQAGEALKAWRESRKSGAATAEVEIAAPEAVFASAPRRAELDLTAVGQLEQELRDLRASVADLNDDIDELDPGDPATLERVDALRRALEAVYHQPFVFRGEAAADGPVAQGEVVVDEVRGYVAGLRARQLLGGSVSGRVRAGQVDSGGEVIGVDVDTARG